MERKDAMNLLKILVLLAVIFTGIAILVPWGNGLYLWGFNFAFVWSIFYIDFFTSGGTLMAFGSWQSFSQFQ